MDYVVPTVYQASFLTHKLFSQNYVINNQFTLNKRFSTFDNIVPPSNVDPIMRYMAIGNGGHTVTTDLSGNVLVNPIQHSPDNISLYSHIPWIIREDGNDLTIAERAIYRMRVEVFIAGIKHYAYYLRLINPLPTNIQMNKITWSGSSSTTIPFVPGNNNINPTPTTNTSTAGDEYITVDTTVPLRITGTEATEIKDAVTKLFGNSDYAIISELGLYMGIDTTVQDPVTAIQYTEVVGTQPTVFMNTFMALNYAVDPIELDLGVGCMEPMQL